MYEAIVIGGGIYGASIAIYLTTKRGFSRVVLIEREKQLLTRASYNNQARVHNGYHYPRSFTTAFRSRVNLPRFIHDHPRAIKRDFTDLYAIARCNSKVTAKQFERFCREIGAKLEPAPDSLKTLFEPRLIEEVFLVEEYALDTSKLGDWAREQLGRCGVELRLSTCVSSVYASPRMGELSIRCKDKSGLPDSVSGQFVFNCTYSGLNQLTGDFPATRTGLKHEITEIALMQAPPLLRNLGVTVMDGPFFSMIPFPASGLHALSHVRYTPHLHWFDQPGLDPYQKLESYNHETRVDRMVRDAARYIPAILDSKYVDSLFEVKTVLIKNESDDGRPIVFERHASLSNCYSILGSKIDNIYDALEKLDLEPLALN